MHNFQDDALTKILRNPMLTLLLIADDQRHFLTKAENQYSVLCKQTDLERHCRQMSVPDVLNKKTASFIVTDESGDIIASRAFTGTGSRTWKMHKYQTQNLCYN